MHHSRAAAVAVVALALSLAIPTGAVAAADDATGVAFEPTSPYAAVDEGTLRLSFDGLNDRSTVRIDEVFSVTATEDLEAVWLADDVDGLTFYRGGDRNAAVDAANPLELAAGETATIGVAIDTRVASSGTGTFVVHAAVADGSPGDPDDQPGGLPGGPAAPGSPSEPGSDVHLTDLSVSTTTLEAGEPLAVTGTYENRGDATGVATARLTVDGIVVDESRATIRPGETATVTFDRTFDRAGEYVVGLDGRTMTVTVTEPDGPTAEFVQTDAALDRTAVEPGQPVSPSATYENRGNATAERTIALVVGGTVLEERPLELEPGEAGTVTFERAFDLPGRYAIAIDGTEVGTVVVSPSSGFAIGGHALSSPLTAAAAPPLTVVGLFVATAISRRRDLWAPWWMSERR